MARARWLTASTSRTGSWPFCLGLVGECADEAGPDNAALITRGGFRCERGSVSSLGRHSTWKHVGVFPSGGDDLPVAGAERADVELALDLLIPAPDRC